MIEEWSQLLFDLFVNDIFGSKLVFGIFLLLGFAYFGVKMRMSFDSMGIAIVSLLLLLSGFGYFPAWILVIIVMILGLIIALALLRIARR